MLIKYIKFRQKLRKRALRYQAELQTWVLDLKLWIEILFIKLTNSSKHSLMPAKTDIEAHLIHEFMPLELFLVFL